MRPAGLCGADPLPSIHPHQAQPKRWAAGSKGVVHWQNAEKENKPNLTLEERIELSWQFLTDITNKVLKSFSAPEQKKSFVA